jgi:hypothetical protein
VLIALYVIFEFGDDVPKANPALFADNTKELTELSSEETMTVTTE